MATLCNCESLACSAGHIVDGKASRCPHEVNANSTRLQDIGAICSACTVCLPVELIPAVLHWEPEAKCYELQMRWTFEGEPIQWAPMGLYQSVASAFRAARAKEIEHTAYRVIDVDTGEEIAEPKGG